MGEEEKINEVECFNSKLYIYAMRKYFLNGYHEQLQKQISAISIKT
jgi:hypothetical protein